LIETQRGGTTWRPSQLLNVTNTTHCYWIPASAAAAAVSLSTQITTIVTVIATDIIIIIITVISNTFYESAIQPIWVVC